MTPDDDTVRAKLARVAAHTMPAAAPAAHHQYTGSNHMLPSLERSYPRGNYSVPRIHLLEVRQRTAPDQGLAWILVEIEEKRGDIEGVTHDAALRLKCQPVSPTYPHPYKSFEFAAGYWKMFNIVKLTGLDIGGGAVFVDPDELCGHRIGTYLMDFIVHWARQWPEATVEPIKLQADQGKGEAGLRRNRFYEQFGLRFDYTSSEKLAGKSVPMPAGELVQSRAWEQNITVHELPSVLERQFAEAKEAMEELRYLKKHSGELGAELRSAYLKPFRWALRQGRGSLFRVGFLALIAAIACRQFIN